MIRKMFFAAVICAGVSSAAVAATKCVALDAQNMTCDTYVGAACSPDWNKTCYLNGVEVSIAGVAFCAEIGGYVIDEAKVWLTNEDGANGCWCKMTSPVVSRWVLAEIYSSDDSWCSYCAQTCGQRFELYSTFRAAMFDSVQ